MKVKVLYLSLFLLYRDTKYCIQNILYRDTKTWTYCGTIKRGVAQEENKTKLSFFGTFPIVNCATHIRNTKPNENDSKPLNGKF
ncbi:hypothetical protein CEXT_163331 [Caerostris extrusa]|uniref:Uncharacterized protein n=1 Tax=Caerostris extrusa TaxID=172846 RepID=A0AAV4T1R8_CAEEX|nr:hypothetical protein CEXT_163331 [Caerostris extrusa]